MPTVFEGLIQNIPAVFYRCAYDESWTTYFMNNAIEAITGYPAADFIDNKVRTFTSVIHPEDRKKVEDTIRAAVSADTSWELEYRLVSKSGNTKWVTETGVGIYAPGGEQLQYLDGFIQNISARKQIELALAASQQQIRDMAFTDTVTGLANRNLFSDRLDQLILDSKRYLSDFALLFIDLDHFKAVNDTHGHLVGDKLLCMAGERISTSFRESDVVARFGGDEFLVIVKNMSDVANIEQIADKLLKKMADSYYINDLELCVTGSVGIAPFKNDGCTSTELIKRADKAMYAAKQTGKNNYRIYDESLQQSETKTSPIKLDHSHSRPISAS